MNLVFKLRFVSVIAPTAKSYSIPERCSGTKTNFTTCFVPLIILYEFIYFKAAMNTKDLFIWCLHSLTVNVCHKLIKNNSNKFDIRIRTKAVVLKKVDLVFLCKWRQSKD